MDLIGIEIKKNSWTVTHLKKTATGLKLAASLEFEGEREEAAGHLKDYISRSCKDPRINVALPREMSVARVLKIPAPEAEAVKGILGFEMVKHLPAGPDGVTASFQILEREGNTFTVLLSICKSVDIEKITGLLSDSGLRPEMTQPWQAGLYNALFASGFIKGKAQRAVLTPVDDGVAFDLFAGPVPAVSFMAKGEKTVHEVKKRLTERQLAEVLLTGGHDDGSIEEALKEEGIRVRKIDNALASVSYGTALCLVDKGRIVLDFKAREGATQVKDYQRTKALAAAVAALFVLAGGSAVLSDFMTGRRLDAAIAELRTEKRRSDELSKKMKDLTDRAGLFREVKGEAFPGPLEALREISMAAAKDTYLTSFEYDSGAISAEARSNGALKFFMRLSRSKIAEGLEFAGPVVKDRDGKENLSLRFKVKRPGGEGF